MANRKYNPLDSVEIANDILRNTRDIINAGKEKTIAKIEGWVETRIPYLVEGAVKSIVAEHFGLRYNMDDDSFRSNTDSYRRPTKFLAMIIKEIESSLKDVYKQKIKITNKMKSAIIKQFKEEYESEIDTLIDNWVIEVAKKQAKEDFSKFTNVQDILK